LADIRHAHDVTAQGATKPMPAVTLQSKTYPRPIFLRFAPHLLRDDTHEYLRQSNSAALVSPQRGQVTHSRLANAASFFAAAADFLGEVRKRRVAQFCAELKPCRVRQILSKIDRLCIELLIALWQHDPGLLASGPDVNGGPYPGCIIECAAQNRPDHRLHLCSWSRLSANTRGAIGANATSLDAPTISDTFDDPWHLSR
jgi:hypothetical protein